jgi:hypothetical protein
MVRSTKYPRSKHQRNTKVQASKYLEREGVFVVVGISLDVGLGIEI